MPYVVEDRHDELRKDTFLFAYSKDEEHGFCTKNDYGIYINISVPISDCQKAYTRIIF